MRRVATNTSGNRGTKTLANKRKTKTKARTDREGNLAGDVTKTGLLLQHIAYHIYPTPAQTNASMRRGSLPLIAYSYSAD